MNQFLLSILTIVCVFFFSSSLAAEQIVVGNFSETPQKGTFPDHWAPLVFESVDKHTIYTHVVNEGVGSIQATSMAGSSGLARKITIDPRHYSSLSFRWKIKDIIGAADLSHEKGDDAPARVWVTFAYESGKVGWWEMMKFKGLKLLYSDYPPSACLVYVWADNEKPGAIIENPNASRVKIIVLESGAEKKGQWVFEQRNILEDYRAAFGSHDVPMISGVAVMTDTDDTGGEAVAWYGDIIFSDLPQQSE
ncbi:MAG TPA: DUF3047 domain-containing protein [Desulfocapsa sulfexigens]|nr:DUF3047 domain-containing protein [Desulfocapsa sulfexigens]